MRWQVKYMCHEFLSRALKNSYRGENIKIKKNNLAAAPSSGFVWLTIIISKTGNERQM